MARKQAGAAPGSTIDTDTVAARDSAIAAPAVRRAGLAKLGAAYVLRNNGPVVLVFAGSSSTAGTAATTAAKRFVNILSGYIQAAFPLASGVASPAVRTLAAAVTTPPSAAGIQGINAGVGGTTSADYLTNTTSDQIGALSPRVVFHMVGSNDFQGGVSVATYKANVLARIAYLKTKITVPHVHVLIHSYERYDTFTPVATWAAYGDALREISEADSANVAFIDLSAAYSTLGIPATDPYGLMDADHIHQNDLGHALMADQLRKALDVPITVAGTSLVPTVTLTPFTSDTFTGADVTTLVGRNTDAALGGTAQAWVSSANFGITSNRLVAGSGTAAGATLINGCPQDLEVSATIVALPSTSSVYITARRTATSGSTANQYRISLSSAGVAILQRGNSGGSVNSIGATKSYVAGDKVALRIVGSVISMLINDVVVDSVTDATYAPGSYYAGIGREASQTFQVDNVLISAVS